MTKARKIICISVCILAIVASIFIPVRIAVLYPKIDEAEYYLSFHLCQRKKAITKTVSLQRAPYEQPTTTIARIVYRIIQKVSPKPRHSISKESQYIQHWEYICNGDNVLVECLVIYDRVFEITIQNDNSKEYYDAYQFLKTVKADIERTKQSNTPILEAR